MKDYAASQAEVRIEPVSKKKDFKLFYKLPRLLYQNLPGFCAPLDLEQAGLLDPAQNPIFARAEIVYFIAWRGDRPCGRIAVVVDPLAIKTWGENIGYFGALDALSDAAVISGLLNTAQDWLKQRKMDTMRGPMTLGYHGESGLMLEGQQEAPMIGTPWHPDYLQNYVAEFGLTKKMDLLTYKLVLDDNMKGKRILPQKAYDKIIQYKDIAIKKLSKKKIAQQGSVLQSLYNDAWEGTFNFVPLQKDEIQNMISQLKPLLRSEHYVQIDKDNKPAAMALVVPNVFDCVADLKGSPNWLGWVKLANRLLRHKFQSGRVVLLGVSHQVRGTVLGAMLPALAIDELLNRRHTLPYKSVELGWILETNLPMRNLIECLVPTPNKVHRIYEMKID